MAVPSVVGNATVGFGMRVAALGAWIRVLGARRSLRRAHGVEGRVSITRVRESAACAVAEGPALLGR
ncbi:hypothetical protein ACWFRB_18875, partial [Rhodococcus sp. NPDC055112]